MPHITLDTTENLKENVGREILGLLVDKLSTYESIDPAAIKAYMNSRSVWVMGEGAAPGFIHVTVGLLTGRPLALRQSISHGIAEVLRSYFAESISAGLAKVTVEIREMDRETYIR